MYLAPPTGICCTHGSTPRCWIARVHHVQIHTHAHAQTHTTQAQTHSPALTHANVHMDMMTICLLSTYNTALSCPLRCSATYKRCGVDKSGKETKQTYKSQAHTLKHAGTDLAISYTASLVCNHIISRLSWSRVNDRSLHLSPDHGILCAYFLSVWWFECLCDVWTE